jgi:transcriptional regulator with XRE-family HTH domain
MIIGRKLLQLREAKHLSQGDIENEKKVPTRKAEQ